jgi:putative oxidoreductase
VERQTVVRVAREVGKWIPVVLLLFIFLPQGWAKFSDTSGWARAFRIWGYPDWFRITIGVMELLAALVLLWPRTAALGALTIIVIMLGGMGTHLVLEHGRHMTSEVVPLTLATIVLIVRRGEASWVLRK